MFQLDTIEIRSKLPLGKTIRFAYGAVFGQFALLAKAAAVPFGLFLAASLAAGVWLLEFHRTHHCDAIYLANLGGLGRYSELNAGGSICLYFYSEG